MIRLVVKSTEQDGEGGNHLESQCFRSQTRGAPFTIRSPKPVVSAEHSGRAELSLRPCFARIRHGHVAPTARLDRYRQLVLRLDGLRLRIRRPSLASRTSTANFGRPEAAHSFSGCHPARASRRHLLVRRNKLARNDRNADQRGVLGHDRR